MFRRFSLAVPVAVQSVAQLREKATRTAVKKTSSAPTKVTRESRYFYTQTGVAPFSLYLQQVYRNRVLRDVLDELPLTARGRMIGKWYRELPATVKAQLSKQAAHTKIQRRRKDAPKRKRKPSAYNVFLSKAIKKPAIKKLPMKKRFAAVAKLWRAQQKKK